MKLPLAYLDASVIEEVPVARWRKVFTAVGWPASLAGKKEAFTHDDIVTALEHDDPGEELLQLLEVLHGLGTESGRDAIVAAMNDRRVPLETLPTDVSEREYALELFLAQRADATLVEVFARAQAQVQDGADERRYNEFMGKAAQPVTKLSARRKALERFTRDYCGEHDLGDHVQVRAFEDDAAYVFQILRSHRTQKPLAVVPGRDARATITYRPVYADILRYDAAVGRLRIAARTPSTVEFYRRTLGRVLFDDESYFSGEAACNLGVLQQRGRAALDQHEVRGVGRVRMTECLWERGDRNLIHLRSSDCFRNIEELRLPLNEGTLLQAKLKIEVAGRSLRPVTVNIRVPSRIEVSNKTHEPLIDGYLTAIGIRSAEAPPKHADLWSLYPWRHSRGAWRAVFGASFDLLVQRGVLAPVRLESVLSPDQPAAGRVLLVQSVEGADAYGVSRMAEVPSRTLSATDLDGFELKPEALRSFLRSELQLSGSSPVWNGGALLELGVLEAGGHSFQLTYALRAAPSGTGALMRERAAAGAHPVLLIPTSADEGSELARVLLGQPIVARDSLIRRIVTACALTDQVPAVLTAPDGTRLVVDTRIGKVWVDGIEIIGLRPDTQRFRFVEVLARAWPRAVSTEQVTTELSRARQDGNTTARQAKHAAKGSIAAALAAVGRELEEDPFPTVSGRYRCAFDAHVA